MQREWNPPTRHQRKQLTEIKRRTGMFMPEGMTFELAKEIIDASPVFALERRARRARGRRKGFARRARRRRLSRAGVLTARPGTIEE
jgi:hypothetical protein